MICSFVGDPSRYVVEFLRPLQGKGTLIAQRAHFVVCDMYFIKGKAILQLLFFALSFHDMHHRVLT